MVVYADIRPVGIIRKVFSEQLRVGDVDRNNALLLKILVGVIIIEEIEFFGKPSEFLTFALTPTLLKK